MSCEHDPIVHCEQLETIDEIKNFENEVDLPASKENKYLLGLGKMYEKDKELYKAVGCYVKVLNDENLSVITKVLVTIRIGDCYLHLKQYKLAIHYYKKTALIAEMSMAYKNLGKCYMFIKNFKDAETSLLHSYKLDSSDFNTAYTLGLLYMNLKNYKKSTEYYESPATERNWSYEVAFSYLAAKEFKRGFHLYENRLLSKEKLHLVIPLEYWNETLPCNKLLISTEQGHGDVIQFYRFVIELSEKFQNMKITFLCDSNCARMFKTYNNIEITESLYELTQEYKLYIMSIPKVLNLTDILPNKLNYINVNEDKLIYWKQKIQHLKKFKVGFVYSGKLQNEFIEKYIPLKEFGILCDLDIDLICIHRKSEVEKDLNELSFKDKIHHFDIDAEIPFEDTIHLIQNLDLLITVDTYIVHIAGVLNVKTWLLLGLSDWRWSDDAHKTYWYDSVELIRVNNDEPLSDALKLVKTKLINILLNVG